MALYTSAQSGPFDVASTWDLNAVPGDADQFNIAYGHAVAVTGDIRPTNGYDNSNVYGKLHIQGSGCYLRMNGSLIVRNDNDYSQPFTEGQNSGGYFRMDPGSTLEIRGTNDDQHSLYVYSSSDRYMTCEVIGNHPGPETTLSSDADNHTTSMSFTDGSKFAAGDWITVYAPERAGYDWARNKNDESLWVHDVDGNTVYFKHFVSPEATITAAQSNKIVVDNASVFRVGYKIIFGTGNNRNVKTITSISKGSNTISLNSNISGSVIGEKVYRTGIEKQHFSGDTVKRLAATLIADSNTGDNTITVNNVNGFQVGDLIMIPNNDTDYANSTGYYYIQDYTVSAINTSTNVITITGGYYNPEQTTLQYNVKAGVGGIVVNLSRDTKIKPPDGATNQNSFIYVNDNGSSQAYFRRWKFKNVEINIGPNNKSQAYTCVGLHGHNSYDLLGGRAYTCEFDGNSIYPSNRSIGYDGMYTYRNHYLSIRNNVFYNHGRYAIYNNNYNLGTSFFSNIICRSGSWTYFNGNREAYEERSYNYLIRNNVGIYAIYWYGQQTAFNSNQVLFTQERPLISVHSSQTICNRWYVDYFRMWPHIYHSDNLKFINSWVKNGWDVTGGYGISRYRNDYIDFARNSYGDLYGNFGIDAVNYIDANFVEGDLIVTSNQALKQWDSQEKAWKIITDTESWAGFMDAVYVPANTRVFVSLDLKSHPSLSVYPQLIVNGFGTSLSRGFHVRKDLAAGELKSQSDFSEITEYTGFRDYIPFTAASKSGYETKSVTVPAFPFAYYLAVGAVHTSPGSGNGRLGWWEKDINISMENPHGYMSSINSRKTNKKIAIASTSEPRKTIWGGG